MRALFLAAAIVFCAATANAADVTLKDFNAETTESLLRLCTADEDKDLGKYAIGFCYGWIEGLEQLWGHFWPMSVLVSSLFHARENGLLETKRALNS